MDRLHSEPEVPSLDLDMQTVTSFALGVVLGLSGIALLVPILKRRQRASHQVELEAQEQIKVDLRRQQADDREINRQLRYQLAVNTPEYLETVTQELELVTDQVGRLQAELDQSAERLAERDRALREARLAIQGIRLQLEEGDQRGDSDLADLPRALEDGLAGDG